jgi:carboxyl-terminal processing protease
MKKKILLLLFCIAYTIADGPTPSLKSPAPEAEPQSFESVMYEWSRTFAQVLQLTDKKHYKISNPEQAMIKAIDAFLNTLDPHSSFLDPKTYKSMLESTSGEFFGIGIVIDNTRKPKDKYLTIVDTIPDGPSDKEGVKPLDKIIEIDSQPLEGMSTEEATSKLKGARNTKVHIKVLREKEKDLLSFDITRDVIKEHNSLSFFIKSHGIHYLSLNMFTENAVRQVEQLLKKAQGNDFKGLILDLRNNSGGLLNAAIDIAGLFLDKGSLVVTTKNKHGDITGRYTTTREPINNSQVPIFILINSYTASAAEILAGALKIHSKKIGQNLGKNQQQKKQLVFLVGTETFGKGSVQEVIPVSNNSAVKLTTYLYFLPDGTTIQGIGIEPDFIIERQTPPTEQIQWFTKYYGREGALNNSIKTDACIILEQKEKAKDTKKENTDASTKNRWLDRAKEMLQTDNQLRDTITLINLFQTFQKQCPNQVGTINKAIEFMRQNHITNDQLDIEEVKL